jgi:group I intron endonuclease
METNFYGVIYKITNNINNKIYIGKTINFSKRYLKYLSEIRNGKSKQYIIRTLKKYGIENFTFDIIDKAGSEIELNEKEKKHINEYESIKNGYNITKGGDGGDTISNNDNKKEIFEKRSDNYKGNKVYQYRHDLDIHIEEMIKLNNNGMSAVDLSKKFNCSEKSIRSRLKNYKKISSSNHHKGKEGYQYRHDLDNNIESIMIDINNGMKIKEVCEKFKCSTKALYKRINILKNNNK